MWSGAKLRSKACNSERLSRFADGKGRSCSLTRIREFDHAARVRRRRSKSEPHIRTTWEQSLTTPERKRVLQQMHFVDKIVSEHRVHQLTAAVGQDVSPCLGFQCSD